MSLGRRLALISQWVPIFVLFADRGIFHNRSGRRPSRVVCWRWRGERSPAWWDDTIESSAPIIEVGDSMKPNPHQCPQTNDPQRNFNCAHYDHCLNQAAKGRWDGFTCVACEFSESLVEHPSVVGRKQSLEINETVVEREGLKRSARKPVASKLRLCPSQQGSKQTQVALRKP